jgi:RNA polymerase sigma-70 factor (ECF subfamily)
MVASSGAEDTPRAASASEDEDRELVELFLAGDSTAFERLMARHYARVFRLVRGLLGDWHLSEDACQEVFAIVYLRISGFRREARFSVWLHRIAVNAALKARRWRRSREQRIAKASLALPDRWQDARETDFELDAEDEIFKLLQPLPLHLRTPLVLRELAGMSYDEVRQVLRCSRGAVEQRIHRAMKLLRELWKDRLKHETGKGRSAFRR